MRKLLLFLAFILIPEACLGQGARYDNVAFSVTSTGVVGVIPNATITVCAYNPANYTGGVYTGAFPCSPTTNIGTDATLNPPFAPNPFSGDPYGNFGFWAFGNANYTITITSPIAPSYALTWTAPGSNSIVPGGINALTIYNLDQITYVDGIKYPRTDAGIQQAITDSFAQLSGSCCATVKLSPGHYAITNGNILVPGPISIEGFGRATWLDNAGLPSTNDVFIVNPTTDGNKIRFAHFMICCTATAGQYAFHLNGATANITNLIIDDVVVNQMGNSAAIPNTVVYGEGTSAAQGTPNVSTFSNDVFIGGIVLTTAGDTVRIINNQISFVGKIDIQFQSGGVSTLIIADNNISVSGGIRIGGASAPAVGAIGCLIERNEIETEATLTEPNNSLIDLDGTAASNDVNCVIADNSLQVLTGSPVFSTANGIRLNWAVNTQIYRNRFERGLSPAHDIHITTNAVNTMLGTNVFVSSTPFIVTNPATAAAIYAANPTNLTIAGSNGNGPFMVNAGRQGHSLDGGIGVYDETGTIQTLLACENSAGTCTLFGAHSQPLITGVLGASYVYDASGNIGLGVGDSALPAVVAGTDASVAGLNFKEIANPSLNVSGADFCYGDSTAHAVKCSFNNDTSLSMTRTVASGTASMTTAGISTGACGTTVTVGASGVATTDVIDVTRNAAATIGNGGGLTLNVWPTSGNVNFNYCNSAAGTITPTAMTVNWSVRRP